MSLWTIFSLWYTNLGGAITDAERDRYLRRFEAIGTDPTSLARLDRFMAEDTGRQFLMFNSIDFVDTPPALPETRLGASARDLMRHYMAHMLPALAARACHPVFLGRGIGDALDLVGVLGGQHWEQAAIVRYRSRRDLVEIASDPEFQARHDYKLAALTKTIAFPVEPVVYLQDLRFLLGLVLFSLGAAVDLFGSRSSRRS